MKVEAWKCPHTGKYFDLEDEVGYQKHVRREANVIKARRKEQRESRMYDVWLAEARETLNDPQDIVVWAAENFRKIYRYSRQGSYPKKFAISNIAMKGVYHHEAQKFSRYSDAKPDIGGIRGRCRFNVSGSQNNGGWFDFVQVLEQIGIRLGTGGEVRSEDRHYEHDLYLYLQDWPGLAREIEGERVIAKLNNKGFHQEWGVPECSTKSFVR